jgi:RNA polymerase sigma-70 factor (ECF subfamily)
MSGRRRGAARQAGDLLRRLGRDEAAQAYDAAIAKTGNAAERSFLRRRRDSLTPT